MKDKQCKEKGFIVVNNLKIALLVLSLVSILAIPVLAFVKFKKSPKLFQGVLWGFMAYFVFNIVSILLTVTVATLILPDGDVGATSDVSGFLLAVITAGIAAVAFLIAGLVTYRFQLKKVDDKRLPVLNSLIFNTLAGMTMVSPLISNILLAINANAGKLEKYVSPETSLETVKAAAVQINNLPVFALLDIGVTYWLDLVVYGIAFVLLYQYWRNKDKKDLKKLLVLTGLLVFSYVFVSRASVHYLGANAFVPFAIKIVFVGLLYMAYKRFEESQNDQHEIIEVN